MENRCTNPLLQDIGDKDRLFAEVRYHFRRTGPTVPPAV
jgi:hypothetical protein